MTPRFTIALVSLLTAVNTPAMAMSPQEASTNLMYFAFAMKEGELCEQLGLPGMALLKRWEQKNGEVLVKSLRRVEAHAAQNPQLTREQARDVSLGLFIRYKDRFDRELAPSTTQKTCVRFGETLRYYEARLVAD